MTEEEIAADLRLCDDIESCHIRFGLDNGIKPVELSDKIKNYIAEVQRLSARVAELEQKENPWGPCYSSVGGEYVYRTLRPPSGYPVVMIWDDEDWVVSIIDSNDFKNFMSDRVVILCPDPSLPNDAPDNAAS